jgi:large subunit ribosomal protein L20
MNYSKFIAALKTAGIKIDRKILADLAEHEPEVFKKVVAAVKSAK